MDSWHVPQWVGLVNYYIKAPLALLLNTQIVSKKKFLVFCSLVGLLNDAHSFCSAFFFISEAFSLIIFLYCTASALLLPTVTWTLSAGTRPWWCLSCTTPPIAPGREFLWWLPSSGSWPSPFPARCCSVSTPQVRLIRFDGVERTAAQRTVKFSIKKLSQLLGHQHRDMKSILQQESSSGIHQFSGSEKVLQHFARCLLSQPIYIG